MMLTEIAQLGARRAPGESTGSWLRAGPLGPNATLYFPNLRTSKIDCENTVAATVMCPMCTAVENGRRRWYARVEWSDPRVVICGQHAQPLQRVRVGSRPARVVFVPLLRELREVAQWVQAWQAESPCGPERRLVRHARCLEDLILNSIANDAVRDVPSTWQWRLWVGGWPIPPSPRSESRFQLADMPMLGDRLALVGAVRMICQLLRGIMPPVWPPICVSAKAYAALRQEVDTFEPTMTPRLPCVFVSGNHPSAHWRAIVR